MEESISYAFRTNGPEATINLAQTIAPHLRDGDVIVLSGDLGAGKTQVAKGIARGLGITADVTSPTFNILISYDEHDGSLALHHFDLYRLEDESQLEDVGYFDLTDDQARGVCLIEWADRFPDSMPDDYLEVVMDRAEQNRGVADVRAMIVKAYGPRSHELIKDWAAEMGLPAWEGSSFPTF